MFLKGKDIALHFTDHLDNKIIPASSKPGEERANIYSFVELGK